MIINSFLFFLMAMSANSEHSSGQTRSLPQGYKNWYIGDFRCGVYVPPSYDPSRKYPLVIYLHGHTDTVSRNMGWYHEPAANTDPAIVLTPKCPVNEDGRWGDTSSKELSPMMKKIFEMIDLIKKKYNVDEDRLYIHGTSMGAIGTYAVIQKFPDMFAGGFAICGWSRREAAPQLSKVPFWAFHGEKDPIVPVEGSRGIYRAVLAYGGKQMRYTEFKGVKHDAWNYVDDNEIYKWLLAQKKGTVSHHIPDKVNKVRGKMDGNIISLEWEKPAIASRPDNDLWYYKIYRNNSLIGEVDHNHVAYKDSLATSHTSSYEYKVSVVNYHFKESDLSAPVRITKLPE